MGRCSAGGLRSYAPIVLVRWEGDAFACAIADMSPKDARCCIEDARGELAKLDPPVSISAGLALLEEGDTLTTLIKRAGAALPY